MDEFIKLASELAFRYRLTEIRILVLLSEKNIDKYLKVLEKSLEYSYDIEVKREIDSVIDLGYRLKEEQNGKKLR